MMFCEGDFEFEFPDALSGFRFDEAAKNQPSFHGLSHCMKAVDFMVELEAEYLFIEVKDIHDPHCYFNSKGRNRLKRVLVEKFRDSFLYRWAEAELGKPVTYLCLIELENALISKLMKELKIHLPEGLPKASRWQRPIAQRCVVVNFDRWNRNFPRWPVRRRSIESTSIH